MGSTFTQIVLSNVNIVSLPCAIPVFLPMTLNVEVVKMTILKSSRHLQPKARCLQQAINKYLLRIQLSPDGYYGQNTKDLVQLIQWNEGLEPTGELDEETCMKIYGTKFCPLINLPQIAKSKLTTIKTDKYKKDKISVVLRSDIAEKLIQVKSIMVSYGVKFHAAGGLRGLGAKVSRGRIPTSLHTIGRAFDFHTQSAMRHPPTDPYVVHLDPANPQYLKLIAVLSNHGNDAVTSMTYSSVKLRSKGPPIRGTLLDITQLLSDHDFHRIRPRKSFMNGTGPWKGAEWWHFENTKGLVPGMTTFGSGLLEIYTRSKLQGTAPWEYRNYVWNGSSFRRPR